MSLHVGQVHSWLRAWRTTRHLRGSQIAYRLKRLVAHQLASRGLRRAQPDRVPGSRCQANSTIPDVPEFPRACPDSVQLATALQQHTLRLVGRSLPMRADAPDWRLGTQTEDRLWVITLHYHAWLYELAKLIGTEHRLASTADDLLQSFLRDWLERCTLSKLGDASLAWNSYAIATRLGWWSRTWHLLGSDYWDRHADLARALRESMYRQATHLAANLEWDLRANHLLRDAVGLAWAGRFFSGPEAEQWLTLAANIAVEQADEQMLVDGGHFERSPFYHLEVMDDWLALARLLDNDQATDAMRATWQRAAEYVRWICHPDGRVAQFNDGATALAEPHLRHGTALGIPPDSATRDGGRWFAESGLVVWHDDQWSLFFDVGEVGPTYQPGHAHADTLSVECSLGGRRLFVDPGCYSYDHDQRRRYDRATGSHNTVGIDAADSSEVWHIFRVGRRARPVDVQVDVQPDHLTATAAHDGYRHLPGRPQHQRTVRIDRMGALQVQDRISGQGEHDLQAGWLLAPDWQVTPEADGWLLTSDGRSVRVTVSSAQTLKFSLVAAPYHPAYGEEIATQRLQWAYRGRLPVEVNCTVVDQSKHV